MDTPTPTPFDKFAVVEVVTKKVVAYSYDEASAMLKLNAISRMDATPKYYLVKPVGKVA